MKNGRTALIGHRQPNRLIRSYYIYIIGRAAEGATQYTE